MEWWVKKVQDNASASLCRVVLQSGALEMIAEIEACRLRLREGDKLTFIHASTTKKRVIVNEEPLQEYVQGIKRNCGIMIVRPQF